MGALCPVVLETRTVTRNAQMFVTASRSSVAPGGGVNKSITRVNKGTPCVLHAWDRGGTCVACQYVPGHVVAGTRGEPPGDERRVGRDVRRAYRK